MSYIENIDKARKQLADVYISDAPQVERLQKILQKDLGREVSVKEAKEMGTDLVELYQALAGKRILTRGGLKNRDRLAN